SMGLLGVSVLLHPAIAAKTNNARSLASIVHLLDIQMVPGTFIVSAYRFSEGIVLILAENLACATGSTGRCFILVLAGSFPRKLSPFQFLEGLTGLGTNPPPEFGQTFPRTLSTHEL